VYIFASVKAIRVILVWENTTCKEHHPLELTSKVTTEFANRKYHQQIEKLKV